MFADLPPMTLDEAQRLYDRPPLHGSARNPNAAQNARAQALRDTALSLGLRAGLSHQLANIETAVKKMSRDLDLVYDFNPLMIQQRVVPPVITEARDLYNQDGDYALRLSGAYYTIQQQARFSSVPPNWRGYLNFPKTSLDRSAQGLGPSTEVERTLWRTAVRDGWDQGVEQANIMLTQAMDRLNRDYAGMARFHKFVIEGKISMPAIAQDSMPVTKQDGTLAVDETLLRITTLPDFSSKQSAWRAVVSTHVPPLIHTPPPPPPPAPTAPAIDPLYGR